MFYQGAGKFSCSKGVQVVFVYNMCVVSLRGKVNIKWMQELLG